MQSSSTPCQRESLPLHRAGTVRMSITANITGRSMTSEELMPMIVELCGMLKGDTLMDIPLTSTRLNTLAPMTLPSDREPCPFVSGQRGAQRHKGQGNDGLGHAQRLSDQGTVVHQKVGTHGNEGRADDEQADLLAERHFLFRLVLVPFRGGGFFHCQHIADHVGHKEGQQYKADGAAEVAGGVGHACIKGGGHKEEEHRYPQALRIHLARAHCHGDGGNEGRVADNRANGVAISDLTMAGQGRGGGDHDLGQGGADRHHRGTNEQLRHLETAGDAGGTVNEPVTALDEAEQAHDKQ